MSKTDVRFVGTVFPTLRHAQWALFFEDLFIPWQFRPESFHLNDDQTVRPDFWLPTHEIWFQVGDDDRHEQDLRRWRLFAAAAERCRCAEPGSVHGRTCPPNRHPSTMVPQPWQAREVLYSVGGIPSAEDMSAHGPLSNPLCSMYTRWDCWYQWTVCPTCGFVGAEHSGRADRLACGHGDRQRDNNPNANDPRLLAAYRLTRQAVAAGFAGTCAQCVQPMNPGDLIGAGSPIGRRRWYHGHCLLVSRRQRYQMHQLRLASTGGIAGESRLLAG